MADQEHVVATIDRGEHGAIRIARKTYKESRPYTDVRFAFRKDDGSLQPTAKGVTIRDGELADVIAALQRIAKHIGATPAQSEQRTQPTERHQPTHKTRDAAQRDFADALDDEDLF